MAAEITKLQAQIQALAVKPERVVLKPSKPETFSGKRYESVDNFVFQLETYFDVLNVTDHFQRIQFTVTLLRQQATDWWRVFAPSRSLGTWQEFRDAIIAEFKPISSVSIARDKIAVLRQRTSVATYTHEFRAITLEIPNMNEEEKLDRYKRGLKHHVRKELEIREPTSLVEAIRIAERLDAVEYSFRSREPFFFKPDQHTAPHVQSSGPAPMDLGNINTSQPPNPSARNTRKSNECWYCHQPGHIAINCPNKFRPSSQRNDSVKYSRQ